MSLCRAIKRAAYARSGREWPTRERLFVINPDGGYSALTPTKGWRRFSKRRLVAQSKLRAMMETIAARKRSA